MKGFFSFIPCHLNLEGRPELSVFPLNVMYGKECNLVGKKVFKSVVYEPDFSTLGRNDSLVTMLYRSPLDTHFSLEIKFDEEKGKYWGTKYCKQKPLVFTSGSDWKTFFIHCTALGPDDNEKCETQEESDSVSVQNLNRFASSLSIEQIHNLSDEEVLSMAMERPWYPGQFGFLLNPQYFRQGDHLAETMYALTQRLGKVGHMKEKKAETWKKVTPEEFAKFAGAVVEGVREKIRTGKGDPEKQKTCPHLDLSGDLLHGPCICDECGKVMAE